MITRNLMQQRGGLGSRAQDILKGVGELTMQKPSPIQTVQMGQPLQVEPIGPAGSGGLPQRSVPVQMPAQPVMESTEPTLSTDMMLPKLKAAAQMKQMVDADPAIEQDPSFQDRAKRFFGSRENMYRLAMAFNTMRLNPDQGLASFLGDELKDIRAQKQSNRTLDILRQRNPEVAKLVEAGMPIKDAMALAMGGSEVKVVGKSLVAIKPDGTHEVLMRDTSENGDATTAFRTLQSRAEAAGLKQGSEDYRKFMISGGAKSGLSIQFNDDGSIKSISEGGMPTLTEGQSKATGFYGRMTEAQDILSRVESEGTDLYNSLANRIPLAGNYMTSPEYKLYEQAQRNFINALLRQESGAAIGKDEFANAELQYFPQPGDTPAVIEQKRRNRQTAIDALRISGGKGSDVIDAMAQQIRGGSTQSQPAAPQIGEVRQGFEYIGGDPSQQSSWKKVQ